MLPSSVLRAIWLSFALPLACLACGDDPASGTPGAAAGEGGGGGRSGGQAGGGRAGTSANDGGADRGGTRGNEAGSDGGENNHAGEGGNDEGGNDNGGNDSSGGDSGNDEGGDAGEAGHAGQPEAACGDGRVSAGEECEGLAGCAERERCTAECRCEPAPSVLPTSQALIQQALEALTIDYPTSLMYRVWALFQAPELPAAYDGEGNAGEDTYLFFELSRVRASLPAEIETAIAPYLVRPTDPTSMFSRAPVASSFSFGRLAAAEAAPPSVRCALDADGVPDWEFHGTDHFVIWSCGGGVGGTDPNAEARRITGEVAEQVYAAMTPSLGAPRPDDLDEGPEPKNRTDIYLLTLNQCRDRGGCEPIPAGTMAAAAPAGPCGRVGGGPLVSSAYLLVGAGQVPTSKPSLDDASPFRYILAHEYFHAVSYNLNLEAQGGTCTDASVGLPPEEVRSWLTEASAEWASFAFFELDDPERRTELFRRYQRVRDAREHGLHATQRADGSDRGAACDLPYQAFLYPHFVQEEQNREAMLKVWTTSQGARDQVGLDNHLNTLFPFADHFRDFAVRNFNRDLPGDPVATPHVAYDPALPFTNAMASQVQEPAFAVYAPLTQHSPLEIAPLAAQTEHFKLNDQVRSLRIDVSDVPNMEHLSLDAIVKVGTSWKRVRVEGPVYEFCRDDGAGADISELYLVFSNFDRSRDGKIAADYELTSRTFCPGGWSGSVRMVRTYDEHSDETLPFDHSVYDRHERDEQRWTVVGTSIYLAPGLPPGYENERLAMRFAGEYTESEDLVWTQQCGTQVSGYSGSGSHSGPSIFDVFAAGPGMFTLSPYPTSDNQYACPRVSSSTDCYGNFLTSVDDNTCEENVSLFGFVADLVGLHEDPEDPGHFVGSATLLHSEEPKPGGVAIQDTSFDWDLRRVVEH